MAFGFFKKKIMADIVFHNGKIYTHDEDYLFADAVACSDGRIIAVGEFEGMEDMISEDTEVIDLQGKYMFPGFIDAHRSPVMRCFEDKYIDLSYCEDGDDVCGKIADWVYDNPDADIIFGFGYKESVDPDQEKLNEVCEDKPALLICENTLNCIINSIAAKIVEETAEEECVEIITPAYIYNLLLPFDFEEIEEAVRDDMEELSNKGITSVLNIQSPSQFESLYQDCLIAMLNESCLKQRFFGSYMANRPLLEKGLIYQLMNRRTTCVELNQLINADTLNIQLNEKDCPVDFTLELLSNMMVAASDKGFNIYIDAKNHDDLLKAYNACEVVRDQGYKNTIVIASDSSLSSEEKAVLEKNDTVIKTWATDLSTHHPVIGNVSTALEAIDEMTINAAKLIGMEDELGKIEKGRMADFAVFDCNPLDCDLKALASLNAEMTVIGGQICYDAEEELMNELYEVMITQHL